MESKLLDTITEIVGEGIVCVNAVGIVTHFNRKAKEITGIVLEGGRSLETLCSSRTTCWGTTTAA